MVFYVGQKVVRVRSGGRVPEGTVCTIVGFAPTLRSDLPGLYLKEFPPRYRFRNGAAKGFNPRHFRPVVERKTDISALQALLNTKSIDELVS